MIEKHDLHGVVNEHIERADTAVIEGIGRHEVAKVGDSMAGHGILHHSIKSISPGMQLIGSAVTVLTRPGDSLYVAHAADIAKPGDVIIVDAGGAEDVAVIGDRIGYYMKEKRGLNGVLVDGAVRDVRGLRQLNFPTFSRSITPRIFGTSGPGAINVPVSCGGVTIYPGDVVLGDDDGVVVVPRADAVRVLALADLHLAGELERLEMVDRGMSLTAVQDLEARLAVWR